MCKVQIDLHDVKQYFLIFKMNTFSGDWLSPIGDMIEYCTYLKSVLTIYGDEIDASIEKYDGSQYCIDYYFNKGDNILNFEFPDEETALYFKMKFIDN